MDLSHRIRICSEQAGLNQAALAKKVGVSKPQVWRWWHGEAAPKHDDLVLIADACGLSLPEFFSDPPGRKRRTQRRRPRVKAATL